MARIMNHAEVADLLGAYALDAVEPDEAEAIEEHLVTCPRCRDELQGHREVVGLLAYTGQDAPEGLWDRVAARIHDPAEGSGDAGPAPVLRMGGPGGASRPRRSPGRRAPVGMGLAAAAAVVIVALLGVQVVRLQDRTNHLSGQVSAMADAPTMGAVRAALATTGARNVVLRGPAGGPVSLDAVILPSGQGYLYDSQLTPLDPSRTYQLWGAVGDQEVSYGVLGADLSGVSSFRVSAGVRALAVTDEVAGGVVTSDQQPVVEGTVS